ncbi:hypothetical protein [Pseudoxanthomonas sp. SE1]|uniref:hypothetical protein n=1 Tax=Pseudoxanthomonas sp. SE1 TaxID=1664560 RepID=UPI00240D8634|nr:hypothetical protein [Pseudoxanthomonas sp. SE1]WFC43263.1 hypothetical protein OY559_07055 [Pseudoxanthomonas sp. SE1]
MAHLRSVPYFTRSAGFCAPGARLWFERHGLDFRAFVRSGLPASIFEGTGCGMAQALARWAREEVAREQQ